MNISLAKIKVKVGLERRSLFEIPNFNIFSGDKILIQGASGKGKTTFLHLLAGLFLPDEGRIHIGETEITQLSDEKRSLFRRSHIGMVFQKLNLIDHLTALENIQLSLKEGQDLKKGVDALKAVGLAGRGHDRTGVLSLGEQQRVAVARVLAASAPLVFADEPTSSLDDHNASEVTRLLLEACAGKTLIVVSHDHRIEKYFPIIKKFEDLIG